MNLLALSARRPLLAVLWAWLALPAGPGLAQGGSPAESTNEIRMLIVEGTVEIAGANSTRWIPTQVSQPVKPFDRIRTGRNTRITIYWSPESRVTLGPFTEIMIRDRPPGEESGLHLFRGIFKFFHRDRPGRIRIVTPGANAGVDGTEFVMEVDEQERTHLWVLEGKVGVTNEFGTMSAADLQGLLVER